jgi:hypothetical protein
MAEDMRADLICGAVSMAVNNVNFSSDAVFHSDRDTPAASSLRI